MVKRATLTSFRAESNGRYVGSRFGHHQQRFSPRGSHRENTDTLRPCQTCWTSTGHSGSTPSPRISHSLGRGGSRLAAAETKALGPSPTCATLSESLGLSQSARLP